MGLGEVSDEVALAFVHRLRENARLKELQRRAVAPLESDDEQDDEVDRAEEYAHHARGGGGRRHTHDARPPSTPARRVPTASAPLVASPSHRASTSSLPPWRPSGVGAVSPARPSTAAALPQRHRLERSMSVVAAAPRAETPATATTRRASTTTAATTTASARPLSARERRLSYQAPPPPPAVSTAARSNDPVALYAQHSRTWRSDRFLRSSGRRPITPGAFGTTRAPPLGGAIPPRHRSGPVSSNAHRAPSSAPLVQPEWQS